MRGLNPVEMGVERQAPAVASLGRTTHEVSLDIGLSMPGSASRQPHEERSPSPTQVSLGQICLSAFRGLHL